MKERNAIIIGQLWVNLPISLLLFGPFILMRELNPDIGVMHLVVFVTCFLVAWLWWSICIPRWRLWAYKQVNSIQELKKIAVRTGLTWPDGSAFERTEIKSKEHALRELELERNA